MDTILRLILQSEPNQAIAGVRRLSDELQAQREELKRSREAELARSQAARIGIAQQILDEKKRQAELKGTAASVVAVQRAEENLRSLQNRAAISARNVQLKLREEQEAGVTGLDRYHGLLQLIPGRFGAIAQSGTGAIGSITSGLGSAGIAVSGLTLAIAGGLVAAIAVAGAGAKYLVDQLKEASQEELSAIGAGSEIQRLYKTDQRTADNFYEQLQQRTEIAGRNTSVSTQDITDLNTIGIAPLLKAYQGAGRSLDVAGETLVDVSKRFAIARQTTQGVTEFQVKNAYSSALTGGLAEAVDRQEFFRNSGLNQIIKEVAGEQGIELANATAAQQVDILQEALKRKVPDSLIQRAQGSVQAQLSAFTDTLFAKRTGIFGVQRDLDKTAPGVQSVYTEFSRTITLFFGDSGTLAETGRLLSKILPPYDIMQDVRSAFQGINTGLESVNEVLRSLNKLFDDIAKSPLGQLVSAIDSKIPKPGDTLFQGSQVVQGNATGGYQIGPSIDLKQAPIVGGFFQATSKFFSDLFGTNAQPRFAGSLSDSFSMPLISAIATERANMPPGAEVVIANSSETVLTPAQMQTLSSAAGKGYEGRGGVTVKNLNIYQQPGEDARSLARRVLEELDLMVSEERSLRI